MVAPLLAAALPALIGGVASGFGAHMANEQADKSAKRQMAFQKQTLQHQYQWGMADMAKAGLNPILAYKQGGAGTAGGSSYTPQNVGAAAVSGASTAQSSALATKIQDSQLENIAADTSLKHAQDKTQAALQIQAMAQAQQAGSNSALAITQAAKTRAEIGILAETISSARAAAARARADEAIYETEAGQWARTLGTIGRELNIFSGPTQHGR